MQRFVRSTVTVRDLRGFVSENLQKRIIVVFDSPAQVAALDDEAVLTALRLRSSTADLATIKSVAGSLSQGSESAVSVDHHVFRGTEENSVLAKVSFVLLPSAVSRHNTPARSHALSNSIKSLTSSEDTLIVLVTKKEHAFAQAAAVARQYPLYSTKSSERAAATAGSSYQVDIAVAFVGETEKKETDDIIKATEATIPNIRLVQKLVDTPPNILHTDSYVEICREVAASLGTKIEVIAGKDLEAQGFGGLWGVGKAAEHLPALVYLEYAPESAKQSGKKPVCLVGKGIVYDTGGLSIKTPTTSMAGMKMDMAGSAAVLGAFSSLVTYYKSTPYAAVQRPIYAILCLAENAVGPLATRPDDIHTLLSGKTVEVNNTDAEGRLVLSDGCYFAASRLSAGYILDIATLTGAQLIATGKNHSALYTNDDELEALVVSSGKLSGDLAFPIPYCPEFYKNEFRSAVADMKNSVADRGNAQSSCAGQFIGNHIEDFLQQGGKWAHIDMAGPAFISERGTGYGVGLLFDIVKNLN